MNNDRLNTEEDVESFSLKNFLLLCIGYWKWFLVSIVVFVGIGLFYVYTRQPVYERSEEILVKDQDSGGGIGDIASSFSGLGLFSSNTKVYNELIAFTSPAVISEVVTRLDLTMNYNERKKMKRISLYGTSMPLDFSFPDMPEQASISFRIELKPDGNFTIRKLRSFDLSGKMVKHEGEFTGKVGAKAIQTPVGQIIVRQNEAYVPNAVADSEIRNIEVLKQSHQGAVEKYSAKLKGDLADQDADVIRLSIKDSSIERADDILNTVVKVYNERWMEDNNKMAQATSKFIDERLALIGNELKNVDKEIADQKTAMRIPDIQEAAKGYMEQDFKMNEELLRTSNMLAMTTYLKEYLEDPANTYNILPLSSGTENQILERQIEAYNELLLSRNNLAENSGEQNPVVKDMNRQLIGMRRTINGSVDSYIANLKNALANITKNQATTKNFLGNSPQQANSLLSVERQQLVTQELYLYLLQKREENELSQAFTADNIRIITPPYGLSKPISPKKALLIIIFFIIGAGIPAVGLFIVESSNTKVRSKKDIENLPLPFAGEIPNIKSKRKLLKFFKTKKQKLQDADKPIIVVSEGKRDIPNEAFRVVRSNIDFMLGRGERTVIALTSFNPGSGKSFIAYNLGASFALKGKKVLIIDGDLRHGSISTYVHSPRKGLSTYLSDNDSTWKGLVVHSDEFKNMDVLPIGNRPPNPAELLENGRLETLVNEAKNDYDIVLIDCPPINIVVDTQIINQYVSRTLFVIRAGLLEKKALNEISGLVDEKKLKNITILLNDTKSEFSSYYSHGNYEAIHKL